LSRRAARGIVAQPARRQRRPPLHAAAGTYTRFFTPHTTASDTARAVAFGRDIARNNCSMESAK